MRSGIAWLARIRLISFLALALITVAGLAACGGGGGSSSGGGTTPTPPPPPAAGTGITVFPGTSSVAVGGKAVFTAYVPSAPSTTTFTWAVTGGAANGTITTDNSGKGNYVAPATVPAGAVTITVTSGNLGGSATITVSAAPVGGVAINPGAIAVPAGSTFQFSATVNGIAATVTQWQVNGTGGGDTLHGTIDAVGNYKAPAMPPPGGSTTITAITAGGSASATATVAFSNSSLSGPYVFSYTGIDSTGYLAVTGSFTANNGILTGGEDGTNGSTTTGSQPVSISGSTYSIGPDGRGTVTIIGGPSFIAEKTWQIVLSGNTAANPGLPAQHALLVRFDLGATGSGTIDQQNTIEAATPFPAGNYVFGLSGIDGSAFKDGGKFTLDAAGKFQSDGNSATPTNSSVWDLNDAGFSSSTGIVTNDTTLTASFLTAPSGITGSSGRGTLNFFSTNTTLNGMTGVTLPAANTFSFVFYVVDHTHVKVIEVDGHAFLSGDIFSEPNAPYASTGLGAVLKNANYVFTVGGASSSGAYSSGGVFAANGGAQTSTGVMDINSGGVQIILNKPLTMSYSVDPNLGRITFTASTTSGNNFQFAGYAASNGSVEMVEIDKLAAASGVAFAQSATGEPAGSFATNISGASASGEQDAGGQIIVTNGTVSGTLDFNNAVNGTVDIGLGLLSGTTIAATDSNGRGTMTLNTGVPDFQLVYYMVDGKTVLMMETDAVHVVLGTMAAQF